jgi:hypothetical protein
VAWPKPVRRWAVRAVGLVALGVLTTYLTSAFLANPLNPFRRVQAKSISLDLNGDDIGEIQGYERFGFRQVWLDVPYVPVPELFNQPFAMQGVDAEWNRMREVAFHGLARTLTLDELLAFGRPVTDMLDRKLSPQHAVFERTDVGWPCHALRHQGFFNDNYSEESTHILVHFRNSVGLRVPLKLPVIPIWGGFLINTGFYAGVWAGLLALPGALRAVASRLRTRRARGRMARGLCPRCAYPSAAASVCPECGARHEAALPSSTPVATP